MGTHDPRMRIWQRAHNHPTGRPSEAPESGNLPPAGEEPLFPDQQPLRLPEHPGQLPPHYRVNVEHPGHYGGFPPAPVKVPHMPPGNVLFDALRSQQMTSHHIVEYLAQGTITPPVGSNLAVTITSANFSPTPLHLRLMEQPFTLHAYTVIRRFCAAPLTSADTGSVFWFYVDRGGIPAVLSAGAANAAMSEDLSLLLPTPITDATPPDLGSIQAGAGAGSTIAAVWQWYINFSFVYLRPGDIAE